MYILYIFPNSIQECFVTVIFLVKKTYKMLILIFKFASENDITAYIPEKVSVADIRMHKNPYTKIEILATSE